MTVPLESVEQVILASYLDRNKYTYSAIRNESDFNNIQKWVKRKREWVRKWIPDFCIVLKINCLLFIELKRKIDYSKSKWGKKWSTVSSEQLKWQRELNKTQWVQCEIAWGAKHAIEIIERLEK